MWQAIFEFIFNEKETGFSTISVTDELCDLYYLFNTNLRSILLPKFGLDNLKIPPNPHIQWAPMEVITRMFKWILQMI